MTIDPYAEAFAAYRTAGWEGVLPLPAGEKTPPPDGFTGWSGVFPSYADCHAWSEDGPHNLALRMPRGVLGIDVDAYKAAGRETITALIAKHGPLPPTWRTTARDDGLSGIYLFRAPAEHGWKGAAGPGVELVHFGHRYAVAWPSTNPDAGGAPYQWWIQDSEGTSELAAEILEDGVVPDPHRLPELPAAWVEELRGPLPSEKAALADGEASRYLEALRDASSMCGPVRAVVTHALEGFGTAASRYDTMRDATRAVVAYGGEGHGGVVPALIELRDAYLAATSSERRNTAGEWVRSLTGAVALAAAADPIPRFACSCGTPGFFQPAAAEEGEANLEFDPLLEMLRVTDLDAAFALTRAMVSSSLEVQTVVFQHLKDAGFPVTDLKAALRDERKRLLELETQRRREEIELERREALERAREEGLLLPAPFKPLDVAREIASRLTVPMRWWRGDFYQWTGTHWEVMQNADVEHALYAVTEFARYEGEDGPADWAPDKSKVAKVLDALGKRTLFRPSAADDDRGIVCTNGVLAPGRELLPHSPERFNLSSLPYAYDPAATAPQWEAFLRSSLPNDQQAIDFLQEWFGYVISGDTNQQKIAALVGKKRGGKGTVGRVLTALVGAHNVAGATLNSLAGTFGLQPLIGKPLCILPDVSWKVRYAAESSEILKMISGQDSPPVDRKNMSPWAGGLPTRFTLMCNDTPTFDDASGALAGRLIVVRFRVSFYGREDITLTERLLTELPGILNWALAGLDRLNTRGRFVEPASAVAIKEAIARESSKLGSFLTDEVVFSEAAAPIELDDLYEHYLSWCEDESREHVLPRSGRGSFSAELANEGIELIRDSKVRIDPPAGRPIRPTWVVGVAPLREEWRKPKSGKWRVSNKPGYMP